MKKSSVLIKILAVIGCLAAIAGIGYAIYRFFTPDYMDDFEDDFEDEFEDFFETTPEALQEPIPSVE